MKSLLRPLFVYCFLILVASSVQADDDKKKEAKAEAKDRYTVPKDADPKALFAYIKELISHRPSTPAEQSKHVDKMPIAVRQAAELIVKKETNKESDAYTNAQGILFELRVRDLPRLKDKELEKLVDDMIGYFKARKTLGRYEMSLATITGQQLMQLGNKKLALKAHREFGGTFEKKVKGELKQFATMLSGVARQLDLMGKPFKLTGKTTEGADFDLAKMKGKVVLVDFWATWCGPCRAEYPNIKAQYEKYHKQGFEVVGVSLDENRGALDRYITDQKVPWKTLHHPGGKHPAAAYYGVQSIPFVVLIDREGKVISTSARGANLRALLDKEFKSPAGD